MTPKKRTHSRAWFSGLSQLASRTRHPLSFDGYTLSIHVRKQEDGAELADYDPLKAHRHLAAHVRQASLILHTHQAKARQLAVQMLSRSCPKLTELRLCGDHPSAGIDSLDGFAFLTELHASWLHFSCSHLESLPRLRKLSVRSCTELEKLSQFAIAELEIQPDLNTIEGISKYRPASLQQLTINIEWSQTRSSLSRAEWQRARDLLSSMSECLRVRASFLLPEFSGDQLPDAKLRALSDCCMLQDCSLDVPYSLRRVGPALSPDNCPALANLTLSLYISREELEGWQSLALLTQVRCLTLELLKVVAECSWEPPLLYLASVLPNSITTLRLCLDPTSVSASALLALIGRVLKRCPQLQSLDVRAKFEDLAANDAIATVLAGQTDALCESSLIRLALRFVHGRSEHCVTEDVEWNATPALLSLRNEPMSPSAR